MNATQWPRKRGRHAPPRGVLDLVEGERGKINRPAAKSPIMASVGGPVYTAGNG